jgi:hypothetical protein
MAFDIPNRSAAAYEAQSILDSTDIDILIAGIAGTEVVSGCAVTAQGSPDMTVAVASGVVKVAGTTVSVSSGNVTISAAHSSLDRRDLVVVNNAGTKSVTAGTAAATPIKPAIPANSIVLAEIYVPAADTDIDADQIIDKRVDVASGGGSTLAAVAYDPGSEVTKVTTSALAMTALDTTNLRLTFTAPPSGRVWVRFRFAMDIGASVPPAVLMGVLDGSTVKLRTAARVGEGPDGGAVGAMAEGIVTGLTPGTSYTWDAAYGVEQTASGSSIRYGGPNDTTLTNASGAFVYEIAEA